MSPPYRSFQVSRLARRNPRRAQSRWDLLVGGEHAQHVVLAQDDVLGPADLHVRAAVLADQDAIALLDFHGDALAVLGQPTGTHGHHFAFLRLLLGGVGDDDPATLCFLLLDAANQDAVGERPNVHCLALLRNMPPTGDHGWNWILAAFPASISGQVSADMMSGSKHCSSPRSSAMAPDQSIAFQRVELIHTKRRGSMQGSEQRALPK